MRIPKEMALQSANAAKKLLLVKKEQCWLFCPYMPGAAYHTVHWLHEDRQSVQCEGPGCPHCPRGVNRKVHIPCLVHKRPYRIETVPTLDFPQGIRFDQHWTPKIIELTGNCFKALEEPSEPDQLAIAWRPGPRQNGPLFFKWVTGILRGVPAELAELDVNKILPGVIGGVYRDYAQLTEADLTNNPTSRIKHNSNLKSDCNDYAEGRDA